MSRFSPSNPREIRAVAAALLFALVLIVGGLFWARWVIGDNVRASLAAMDVQSISTAVRQYEPTNGPALRAKLAPAANWHTLSRAEYDWLITQLAPIIQLNDDVPDDWRTAGLTDPWQRAYQVEVLLEGSVMRFRVRSLGADGQAGTPDDIISPESPESSAVPATAPAP